VAEGAAAPRALWLWAGSVPSRAGTTSRYITVCKFGGQSFPPELPPAAAKQWNFGTASLVGTGKWLAGDGWSEGGGTASDVEQRLTKV